MLSILQSVVKPAPVKCKICDRSAPLIGVVDFNKNGGNFSLNGVQMDWKTALGVSGIPIYYRQCEYCQFIFTEFFDSWSDQDWQKHVYNAHYVSMIDPDGDGLRARLIFPAIDRFLSPCKTALQILDYGGGNGSLAELMKDMHYHVSSYDKFLGDNQLPNHQFNLIIAVELIEHISNQQAFVDELNSLLEGDAALLIFTLCSDHIAKDKQLDWYYISPCSGHISIHSAASLDYLFNSRGMKRYLIEGAQFPELFPHTGFQGHLIIKGNPTWINIS